MKFFLPFDENTSLHVIHNLSFLLLFLIQVFLKFWYFSIKIIINIEVLGTFVKS